MIKGNEYYKPMTTEERLIEGFISEAKSVIDEYQLTTAEWSFYKRYDGSAKWRFYNPNGECGSGFDRDFFTSLFMRGTDSFEDQLFVAGRKEGMIVRVYDNWTIEVEKATIATNRDEALYTWIEDCKRLEEHYRGYHFVRYDKKKLQMNNWNEGYRYTASLPEFYLSFFTDEGEIARDVKTAFGEAGFRIIAITKGLALFGTKEFFEERKENYEEEGEPSMWEVDTFYKFPREIAMFLMAGLQNGFSEC